MMAGEEMTAGGGQTPDRMRQPPDEASAIYEVIVHMMDTFPSVTRDEVVHVVAEEHQALNGTPVRDHVPAVVEMQAKMRLQADHPPPPDS